MSNPIVYDYLVAREHPWYTALPAAFQPGTELFAQWIEAGWTVDSVTVKTDQPNLEAIGVLKRPRVTA